MTPRLALTLIAVLAQLVVTVATLALPNMTHRDLLFGVPVPQGFRASEPGRHALRIYRTWIAIPTVIGLAGIAWWHNPLINIVAIFLPAAASVAGFVLQNRHLKPYAVELPQVHRTALVAEEPLPWFVWLGLLPLLLLAGVATFLHQHWNQIPLRYPVHFDLNGNPNRWADRTIRGVYGPLIFGGELTLLLFAFAIAGWYGSRRSEPLRKPMVAVMLVVELTVAIMFGEIPLQVTGFIHVPLLVMVFGPLLLAIGAIGYAIRQSNQPRGPIDPTPEECWKGGIIYYNPNDAALFVQRRDGVGYTINMANRWSWMIYVGLVLVLATGPIVLH